MDTQTKIVETQIIQTKIIAIVRQVSGKPINPSPEESLFESGVLDSFTLADLVSALEKEFSLKIPDSDLSPRKFDSVGRIQAYLQSRT
jgi:acyl carrier protein